MLARHECEAGSRHSFAKVGRVLPQACAQLIARFQDVEHAHGRCGHERRDAVREQVGPRALAQPSDDFFAARRIPAAAATERFAERAGEDVDSPDHVAILVRAPTLLADEPSGVRIVDHDERIVAIG